ncbi:DUF6063 family protein [Methanocalculus sp.]|uniref:DUF6063 family protein n=1 Tax=Methanocalculus sp. TaxID=2004547 RepID=UPI0026359E36|nr:DUF6063 family protein [Methanocalculus sp.]MDG6249510.1 DUF6063 family protein [Methanocalculus sp.]
MKFDRENLGIALEMLHCMLEKGSISRKDHPKEFLRYDQEAELREVLEYCAEKHNLLVCRYQDALFLSPGVQNQVFGLSNDDIRKSLGRGFNNPEMYTVFFIIHVLITEFYHESAYDPYLEKLPKLSLVTTVEKKIAAMGEIDDLEKASEELQFNFKVIHDLWSSLPTVEFKKDDPDEKKQRGVSSKHALINETIAFLEKNQLVREHNEAIYLTHRCKAIIREVYSNREIQDAITTFIEDLGHRGGDLDA